MEVLNHVLSESDQGPATSVAVQANFDLAVQTEHVVFDALGGRRLVQHEVGMEVKGATAQVRSFKGVGFGDAGSRTLDGIEAVAEVAMTTIKGGHRGHKAGCVGGQGSTEFLEQTEPAVGGQSNLRGRVGIFRPLF